MDVHADVSCALVMASNKFTMDTRRELGRPHMDSRARAKSDSKSEAGEVGCRCAVRTIPSRTRSESGRDGSHGKGDSGTAYTNMAGRG